jgi:hypothetical protein
VSDKTATSNQKHGTGREMQKLDGGFRCNFSSLQYNGEDQKGRMVTQYFVEKAFFTAFRPAQAAGSERIRTECENKADSYTRTELDEGVSLRS